MVSLICWASDSQVAILLVRSACLDRAADKDDWVSIISCRTLAAGGTDAPAAARMVDLRSFFWLMMSARSACRDLMRAVFSLTLRTLVSCCSYRSLRCVYFCSASLCLVLASWHLFSCLERESVRAVISLLRASACWCSSTDRFSSTFVEASVFLCSLLTSLAFFRARVTAEIPVSFSMTCARSVGLAVTRESTCFCWTRTAARNPFASILILDLM